MNNCVCLLKGVKILWDGMCACVYMCYLEVIIVFRDRLEVSFIYIVTASQNIVSSHLHVFLSQSNPVVYL